MLPNPPQARLLSIDVTETDHDISLEQKISENGSLDKKYLEISLLDITYPGKKTRGISNLKVNSLPMNNIKKQTVKKFGKQISFVTENYLNFTADWDCAFLMYITKTPKWNIKVRSHLLFLYYGKWFLSIFLHKIVLLHFYRHLFMNVTLDTR